MNSAPEELLDGLKRCIEHHHLAAAQHHDKRKYMERHNFGPPHPKELENEHFAWAGQISEAIRLLAGTWAARSGKD